MIFRLAPSPPPHPIVNTSSDNSLSDSMYDVSMTEHYKLADCSVVFHFPIGPEALHSNMIYSANMIYGSVTLVYSEHRSPFVNHNRQLLLDGGMLKAFFRDSH